MVLWVEGGEVQRQKHVTPRSCEGKQNQGPRPGLLETGGWRALMDTGGFWPNWLSGLEKMRSHRLGERHGTKGQWSPGSRLEGQVGKRPSEEERQSYPEV